MAADSAGASTTKTINVNVGGGPNRSLSYDANGNLLNNGAGTTYQWDAENRLVSIAQLSGTTGFVYDGLGHRVQETSNGTLIKQWIWCGTQLCEERDANGNVTNRFYAQGEQLAGVPYFYTRDHLGSIREMTDSNENVQAEYDYDPYGRVTEISGSISADFGFTGDFFHKATGLSLTIYRAYDPNLGRWLSRDPIGTNGGINLYGYVGNDPTDWIDPFGLAGQLSFSVGVVFGDFIFPADNVLRGYNVSVVVTTDGQILFQKQTISATDGAGAFIGVGGSIGIGQSSCPAKTGVTHDTAKHLEGDVALLDVGTGVSVDSGKTPADTSLGGFAGPRIKYTGGLGAIAAIGTSETTTYAPW